MISEIRPGFGHLTARGLRPYKNLLCRLSWPLRWGSALILGVVALNLTFAAGVADAQTAAQTAPSVDPGQTVLDGVYTDAQAERGADIYRRTCRKCHYADLLGDTGGGTPGEVAPGLVGQDFAVRWHGATVADLFLALRRSMPLDRPGTLREDRAVDVISYLLQMNDYPAGNADLPPDLEVLERILIPSDR